MKLELNDLPTKLSPLLAAAKRYVAVLFLVIICGIYGFLTYRINVLTQAEPDPAAISEQLETVARPRVDENAVSKMKQLEQTNIEIKTLFDEARNNPFSE